jgi:hypothetical protein
MWCTSNGHILCSVHDVHRQQREVTKPACLSFCIVLQIASDFDDISCEGCTPNVIAQISFWGTLNVYNCTFFEAEMKPTEFL